MSIKLSLQIKDKNNQKKYNVKKIHEKHFLDNAAMVQTQSSKQEAITKEIEQRS